MEQATSQPAAGDRTIHRPHAGRMLAGVAAGIAEYLDVDVTLVRIVLVVLAFVGGLAVPLYLAAWLLVPDEGEDTSIAEDVIDRFQAR